MALELPGQDKATITFGFIGLDTENDVRPAGHKLNANTPRSPVMTGAFSTAANLVRLRVTEVDETGLTTDFKDLTITLANSASAEKVLGTFGAAYMNFGNFEVSIEGTVVFTDPRVPAAIRANDTVTFDAILKNGDGGVAIDIAAMTLGDGARNLVVNESVNLSLTGDAFADPTLNTSIGISFFPVLP
jgi:hypothetical protein